MHACMKYTQRYMKIFQQQIQSFLDIVYIERRKENYILGMGRMSVNFVLYFKYFEGERTYLCQQTLKLYQHAFRL